MGGTGLDPKDARTPAEFVATMRRLRSWADLSYRQLERKAEDAGDVLPRATISGALTRADLPREELLIAFVRACGGDVATVDAWVDARRRLAMSQAPAAPGDDDAAEGALPIGVVAIPTGTAAATSSDSETVSDTAGAVGLSTTVQSTPTTERPKEEARTAPAPPRPAPEVKEPGRRSRTLLLAVTGACVTTGVLVLIALWLSGDKPGNDKADAAPSASTSPAALTPSASAVAAASPTPSPSMPGASPSSGGESGNPPPAGTATQPTTPPPAKPAPPAPAPAGMPKAGWVRMHPASSSGLCITEGRERNGRTNREIAVQRSCAEALQPRVYLESLGGQTYRIQWHHPRFGKGCLGVDEALVEGAQLMSPGDCTDALGLKYRLEPSGSGYRLRPLDSNMCIGILPPRTEGAEAIQAECTGASDQVFRFTPV
ncbi:RICIN domain-containing protein [Streptomyces globosus]|uniref:RICIN domain-containing protein n=1 Tax=Streptomyces globosus TaxID=68209 RepID=UPI0038186A79